MYAMRRRIHALGFGHLLFREENPIIYCCLLKHPVEAAARCVLLALLAAPVPTENTFCIEKTHSVEDTSFGVQRLLRRHLFCVGFTLASCMPTHECPSTRLRLPAAHFQCNFLSAEHS